MRVPFVLTLFLSCITFLSTQTTQNYGSTNDRIRGNGNVISKEISSTADFTDIKVCCAIKVEVAQGPTTSIRVEGDENLLPYLITEVSGNTLDIYIQKGIGIKTDNGLHVYVTMPDLREIEANSASKLKTTTTFTGTELDIDCSSAAKVFVDFSGQEVNVDVNSAGVVEMEGKLQDIDLAASSAGKIDAFECRANRGKADVNSAASIRLHVTEQLDAEASSGGSIRYRGTPTKVYTDANSGGRVSKL